jgi:hypothetical protein
VYGEQGIRYYSDPVNRMGLKSVMRRISSIRTTREAELEKRREDLRNGRWARRRSMVLTGVLVLLVATSGGPTMIHLLRGVFAL